MDLCRVCRNNPADSPEHFIPKAAGNRGKVTIVFLGQGGSYVSRPGTDGYYERVLCTACNGECSVYAQQYVEMLRQLEQSSGLSVPDGRQAVTLRGIYPLRLVKQLILQFLCAPPFPPAAVWLELQRFVRDREATLPPGAPSIYLYRNLSTHGRVVPCCCVLELRTRRTVVVSEVSWPPVGAVFCFNPHPKLEAMQDITEWCHRAFSAREDLTILLPQYEVSGVFPLVYGNVRQVEQDERERLPMYLLHVPEGSAYALSIGAIVERTGYRP